MKYLRLFESLDKYEIDEICKKYVIVIKDYTINLDGSIDSYNVDIDNTFPKIKKLPIKFNKVNGWFDCRSNELITLEGSPIEVNGHFYCQYNKLTSFKYAPKIIRGSFYCQFNNIKSFEYFPSYVKGDFYCDVNPISYIWYLFRDTSKIELLNDFDIFRDEDTDIPAIFIDRLNDFLLTIGKPTVEKVNKYKNI